MPNMQSCNTCHVVLCFVESDGGDLHQVLEEVHNITEVVQLGLNLGLHPAAIVKIKLDNKTLEDQKTWILYAWLQRKDIVPKKQSCLPTWSELADAVAKESTAVSRAIRQKHCKMLS